MMSKPSGMWHMVFWMFGFASVVAIMMIVALLFDQIPAEELFATAQAVIYFFGVILGGGLVTGLYFGVIIGVPLGILSELLVETKNRAITAESIQKRQLFIYALALVLVFGLANVLMVLPPINDFDFTILNEMMVAGILAVLMLFAVFRYLTRLSAWVKTEATEAEAEVQSTSVKRAETATQKKNRKGELPPLVLKTDDDTKKS